MIFIIVKMSQSDFGPLQGQKRQADVLKENFNMTKTNINDADFRRSKY